MIGTSRLESSLAATHRAASLRELTRRDLDFHEAVMEASGHARLARLWRSLRWELELWLAGLQQHERRTKRTREATVADHEELLRCFREESPAAAERLMRRQLAGWEQYLSAPM